MTKKIWVVDLGEDITKITFGSSDKNGIIIVENYWIEKTPRDVFREGLPQKNLDLVVFLRSLLKGHHPWDELMLVFNHPKMILASFDFPMMAVEEVHEAFYWKMQVIIPERFEDWRLDFLARERIEIFEYLGVNEKKLDVLGIGIPKNILTAYCSSFKGAKHVLKIIEPQFHGLGRLLNKNGEKTNLIIDMGYTSTRLLLYSLGFLKEERRIKVMFETDLKTFLSPVIEGVLECFQSPLSHSRSYENDTIFLLGGGSLVPGVLEYLREKINKKIVAFSILARNSEVFKFQKEISEKDLCLLLPCLGGMLKGLNKK